MSAENKREKKRALIIAGAIGLAICFVLNGFMKQQIDVAFSNGCYTRIIPASFWSSCGTGSNCQLFYQPPNETAGTISLWQDLFDKPIIATLSGDGKSLLCLYNYDVDLRLLKIDPAMDASHNSFSQESGLNAIVYSSPWHVEAAGGKDWQAMLDYLKRLSPEDFKRQSVPAQGFGFFRLYGSSKPLQQQMEVQINLMKQDGTNQWPPK